LLAASPLVFAVAQPALAASKKAPPTKIVKVACTTNVAIMIARGDNGVTPPVQQGSEYGSSVCGRPLGQGVQADGFTVAATGDTVAKYSLYFHGGSIHGSYDLSPQESPFNFLQVNYTGTLKVTGGTGAFVGMTGTGTMTCATLDGVHTTCTDKLKLKQKQ
jgi:hypothetical protein